MAASLRPRSVVLAAEEDFTSVLFPFLRADLEVRLVPLDRLLESITDEVDLVAVSAVQSADGRLIDLPALADAAVDRRRADPRRRHPGGRLAAAHAS